MGAQGESEAVRDGADQETVVERPTPLADRRSEGASGPAGGESRVDLGQELRASRDWRQTSRGPTADLAGIDLSGEDLRGVDFSGASLAGASFANANLADANFKWARLTHADFTGATGLVGSQFARADLTGARLALPVRFVSVENANQIAESTGKLFLTLLLACAYSWLTINSTLDAKLLTDTGASQLPILNTQIPIVNFYALVPIGLVALSLITMLQGQRLWAAVGAAPAALADGTTMADQAGAWVLGPWAAERVMPASERGFLTWLQARLGALVGWWLVPVTVAWFWVRYLHRHDWAITGIHLFALSLTCTAAALFQQLAYDTLPEQYQPAPTPARNVWRVRLRQYLPSLVVAIGVPVVFGMTSYAAIRGVHPAQDAELIGKQTGQERPSLNLQRTVPSLAAALPRLLTKIGMRPFAQLEQADVSTRLTTGNAVDTGAEAKATGARLVGADLRFASAEGVFLALSDLQRADLLGANLWFADLRGANLTGASLSAALLRDADIRKARAQAVESGNRLIRVGAVGYFDTLYCSRTSFTAANLRYARLNGSDLRGAAFDDALLQGATFTHARLTHATFTGADLDGTDFRGAFGLKADQILAARHVEALYDSTLLAILEARSPDRFIGYNASAIEAEVERERLSGEDEPDSLGPGERQERQKLVRAAYRDGPAPAPTSDATDAWQADTSSAAWRADTSAAAHPVPQGCMVERVQRPARVTEATTPPS